MPLVEFRGDRISFPDSMGSNDIQDVLGAMAASTQAVGEFAAMLGTSSIAEPLSGLAAIATGNPSNVRKVQEALTYQPKTRAGMVAMQAIGRNLSKLSEATGAEHLSGYWRDRVVPALQEQAGPITGSILAAGGLGLIAAMSEVIPGSKGTRRLAASQVGALGDLGKNKIPMAGRKWFHGSANSQKPIENFDPSLLGSSSGAKDANAGFYFGGNRSTASAYLEDMDVLPEHLNAEYDILSAPSRALDDALKRDYPLPEGATQKEGMAIMMQRIDDPRYKEADKLRGAANDFYNKNSAPGQYGSVTEAEIDFKDPYVVDFGGDPWDERRQMRVIQEAKSGGHDGVIFKNMQDSGWFGGNGADDIAVAFDSKSIRTLNGSPKITDLPMDNASRMARAKEQNYIPTYHGTTQDIPQSGFRMGGYADSDLGQGIYSTTSPYDASFNYADPKTSQDLIGKIERRAEQLEGELDIDFDAARQQAMQELVGSPQVHPSMARTDNPVRIGGDETQFDLMADADIDAVWDDASEQIADQYADEIADGSYDAEEIKELTTDFARDLAYENGYVDEPAIFQSLRNVAHRFDDVDIERAIGELSEQGYESMGAEDLIDALKGSEGIQYATSGDTGDLASGELIRQAFEDAGYDSIIDATPNKKWGSESGRSNFMPDLEGAEHVIVFNPNQMRSTSAAFDPAKRSSSNLLAGAATAAVGLGALSGADESKDGYIKDDSL